MAKSAKSATDRFCHVRWVRCQNVASCKKWEWWNMARPHHILHSQLICLYMEPIFPCCINKITTCIFILLLWIGYLHNLIIDLTKPTDAQKKLKSYYRYIISPVWIFVVNCLCVPLKHGSLCMCFYTPLIIGLLQSIWNVWKELPCVVFLLSLFHIA